MPDLEPDGTTKSYLSLLQDDIAIQKSIVATLKNTISSLRSENNDQGRQLIRARVAYDACEIALIEITKFTDARLWQRIKYVFTGRV